MKLYHTPDGTVIETAGKFYKVNADWDELINDDDVFNKATALISNAVSGDGSLVEISLPVIGQKQELWACGVTYLRSKVGRQEESKDAGGGDFYARVYEAERPECFFKSTPQRVVGNKGFVRIRKDSTWDVPEPELTLVVTHSGKIIGYTIGNDMSSRSIEGENPLYLPQAKTYDGCAALGPCILITKEPIAPTTTITLTINRASKTEVHDSIAISQMKRTHTELASFVFKECSFPNGCMIMTGTGIVPHNDFTLKKGDEIIIDIEGIGSLTNWVA